MTNNVEGLSKMKGGYSKVIHNSTTGFAGKNELYTKLSTLSTENVTNFVVYIVKKSNRSFVQIP